MSNTICPVCKKAAIYGYQLYRYNGHLHRFHDHCFMKFVRWEKKQQAKERTRKRRFALYKRARKWRRIMRVLHWLSQL